MCSGRDLDFKRSSRARAESSLDEEKLSAYSVSVALRASMALGFQLGASSVKFICRMWGGAVIQRRRNYPRLSSSSRWRSSVEGSSEVSGVTLEAGEEGAKVISDSATAVMSCCSL